MKTLLLLLVLTAAAEDPVLTKKGVAAGGYDVVAYFTGDRAVEGSTEFTAEHRGATFRFASAEHRDAFVADPEKYVPQYGGWCAFAMARGKFYKTDPEAWSIRDGKLYLNYDAKVQKKWEQDADDFIEQADDQWPKVKHKKQ